MAVLACLNISPSPLEHCQNISTYFYVLLPRMRTLHMLRAALPRRCTSAHAYHTVDGAVRCGAKEGIPGWASALLNYRMIYAHQPLARVHAQYFA